MGPRASWKGHLKLSAVSCAVALYPAQTDSAKVSFNTLNARTGHRVRQQLVDEATGDAVEREQLTKGVKIDRDQYVVIEAEELDGIRIESSRTVCVERFVPAGGVDPVFTEGAHFMAPAEPAAATTFAVLRSAMERRDVVAIGRVVLSTRERLVMLSPRGRGILMTSLHWPHEVRADTALFGDIPDSAIDEEMLELATHVIGRKRGSFDHAACEDAYEEALLELIRAKQEGREPAPPRERPTAQIISLKEALRQSLDADSGGGRSTRRTAAGSRNSKSDGGPAEKVSRPTRRARSG